MTKLFQKRCELLAIRLTEIEKKVFSEVAHLAGVPMSIWARERLRLAASHELEASGGRSPFRKAIPFTERFSFQPVKNGSDGGKTE